MTAAPDSLQQRYETIERVYSERLWDDVAQLSEELLLDLPNDPGHPLRQRLQLLLGHTYLYGYQDAATATGFYSRVQAVTKEPVLLDIAAQGLEQCASQTVVPTTPGATTAGPEIANSGQVFPFNTEAVNPAPANTGTMPAMPWMEQLGGIDPAAARVPSATTAEPAPIAPTAVTQPVKATEPLPELVVEVIDEPELIEVAQANPATAQELEIAIRTESPASVAEQPVANPSAPPVNSPSPEELAELSKGLLRVVIR